MQAAERRQQSWESVAAEMKGRIGDFIECDVTMTVAVRDVVVVRRYVEFTLTVQECTVLPGVAGRTFIWQVDQRYAGFDVLNGQFRVVSTVPLKHTELRLRTELRLDPEQ